jgi:hypothetical protein
MHGGRVRIRASKCARGGGGRGVRRADEQHENQGQGRARAAETWQPVAWRDAARAVFRLASLRCGAGARDGQPGHCTVPVRGEFARVCLRPGLRHNADYGNLLWWKWWQNQGEIAKMARSPKFMAQWQRNPGGGGHEIWQSA